MLYDRSQMTQLFTPSKLASSVWWIAWPWSPRATGLGTQESLEDAPTEGKGPLRRGCQHRPVFTLWAHKMQKKAGPEGPEARLGLRGFSQTPCRESKEVLCPHGNSGTPSQVRPADANSTSPTLSLRPSPTTPGRPHPALSGPSPSPGEQRPLSSCPPHPYTLAPRASGLESQEGWEGPF